MLTYMLTLVKMIMGFATRWGSFFGTEPIPYPMGGELAFPKILRLMGVNSRYRQISHPMGAEL